MKSLDTPPRRYVAPWSPVIERFLLPCQDRQPPPNETNANLGRQIACTPNIGQSRPRVARTRVRSCVIRVLGLRVSRRWFGGWKRGRLGQGGLEAGSVWRNALSYCLGSPCSLRGGGPVINKDLRCAFAF